MCIIQTNCIRGICTFCLRRTKKYCSSVQATHAVLLSFTRKTCKFRLYRIVFGELYLKSNLSCLTTVFDTGYIFEIFMCPDGNAPYFIILMSRFCLSRGECCRSQNSLALYCRYRWLSFEVFVNWWISFDPGLGQYNDPRSGFYRTRHSTKMRCPTNKMSGVSAVHVKLYLVRYILLYCVDCRPPVSPYARIKLLFKTFKIKYFLTFWDECTGIRPKKRKSTIPKVIKDKDQTYFIFYN